jgi:hypothetical protein
MIRALKKSDSPEIAAADIMYDVLGEPIVDALADIEGLSEDQLQAVMRAVQKYAMGAFKGLGN